MLDAVFNLRFPSWTKPAKGLVRLAIRLQLSRLVKNISNREEWNNLLAIYVKRVLADTSDGFTYSGIQNFPEGESCLFVSNHRDITLDPILVNYALWQEGMATTQIAIGDNLIKDSFEAEFMQINNSFIILRSAKGAKAQYLAMQKTSQYIRHTLNRGQSIWIAQREGRAKDGIDRTEPAILKMFSLADGRDMRDASHLVERINIVPTSFTYELDPCAPLKAKEVAAREREGTYHKDPDEDTLSMALGITGFKGRIHVSFANPVKGHFDSFESVASVIDDAIHRDRQRYSIFQHAADRLAERDSTVELSERVLRTFNAQLEGLDSREESLLLAQYANQVSP